MYIMYLLLLCTCTDSVQLLCDKSGKKQAILNDLVLMVSFYFFQVPVCRNKSGKIQIVKFSIRKRGSGSSTSTPLPDTQSTLPLPSVNFRIAAAGSCIVSI